MFHACLYQLNIYTYKPTRCVPKLFHVCIVIRLSYQQFFYNLMHRHLAVLQITNCPGWQNSSLYRYYLQIRKGSIHLRSFRLKKRNMLCIQTLVCYFMGNYIYWYTIMDACMDDFYCAVILLFLLLIKHKE